MDQNKAKLEAHLSTVKNYMTELKDEILADDERFEDEVKEGKVQEMIRNKHNQQQLVLFHKQKVKLQAIEEQKRLKRLRHSQYDKLLLMVFRFWTNKAV